MKAKPRLALVLAVALVCVPLISQAAVITVPGDYSTIQAAIDAATHGDEIVVYPDYYRERISFGGKNIILRSTDPNDPWVVANAIIDGHNVGATVVFNGTELTTCVLSGFTIKNGDSSFGGGIEGNGTLATIESNIICDNWAGSDGGGLAYCHGTIRNNTISGNSARRQGAGLSNCDGVIQNNIISANSAQSNGGGLYGCGGTIENNVISDNSAQFNGGGLFSCGGAIKDNIISGNTAVIGAGLANCNGTIQNNTILGNSANDYGGGLSSCNGTIRNNIISGNSVSVWNGGGLYNCQFRIRNNTIWGNSAPLRGGGLYSCNGDIRNCIIWNNTAPTDAQVSLSSIPSYSCIENWTGGGDGNITDNPQLVDPANGDFHLQSNSLCIDAGRYVPDVSDDFEGDPRPFDGTSEQRGDGSDFDIGADEYYVGLPPTPTPTPIAPPYTFNFDSGTDSWVFSGTIIPFDSGAQTSTGGHLGLSPSGSSYCFGFWDSPEIVVNNGVTYKAEFSVASSLSTGELVPQCRLRGNQVNGYGSAVRVIASGGDGGGAPLTTPRTYDLLFTPLLLGAQGTVTLSFDILNFDPFDDANAWIYLESVTVDEVSVTP